VGGLLALVHEGDSITIDADRCCLQLNVPEAELASGASSGPGLSALHARRTGQVREGGVERERGGGHGSGVRRA